MVQVTSSASGDIFIDNLSIVIEIWLHICFAIIQFLISIMPQILGTCHNHSAVI